MKKIIALIMVVVVLIIAIVSIIHFNSQKPQKKAKLVVKIGAILPLTGNFSWTGVASQKALAKAIEDENKNPNNRFEYRLIFEDDQMMAKNDPVLANKLLSIDRVNVLMSTFTPAGKITSAIAAKNKVINFNMTYSDDVFVSKYNFNNFFSATRLSSDIVEFLSKKGIKNVSLISQNYGSAPEIFQNIEAGLKRENILFSSINYNSGVRDFTLMVAKEKQNSSEAIVIYALDPDFTLLLRELYRQKVNKTIIFCDLMNNQSDITPFEGIYDIGTVRMSDEMRTHIGLKDPNVSYATYWYDMGTIIVRAFESAATDNTIPSADQVADTLRSKRSYTGIVGDYILENNGRFNSSTLTTIVQNGKLVEVK